MKLFKGPFSKYSLFKDRILQNRCCKYAHRKDAKGIAKFSKAYDKLKAFETKQATRIEKDFLGILSMPFNVETIERVDAVVLAYEAKEFNKQFEAYDIVSFDSNGIFFLAEVVDKDEVSLEYSTDLDGVLVEVISHDPATPLENIDLGDIIEVNDKLTLIKKND